LSLTRLTDPLSALRSSRRYRDEYDYPPRERGGRRDRDRHDRRGSGTPNPREDRARSPQPTEEEREMRSVFVSQLSARVTDRELGIFFEHGAGKVRDARVIVDRISKRSKGVGYVEFVDLESVAKALAMSETKLLGIPIIVQYTEAEKNRQARVGTGTMPPPTGPDGDSGIYRLYVGSLNFALTEQDIRQVFQPFGEVTLVDLHKDPVTGKSKGYAFVQFADSKDAMQALDKMNNFPLAGREIRVGLVSDRSQNPAFLDAARATVAGAYVPGQAGAFQAPQREQPLAVDDGSGKPPLTSKHVRVSTAADSWFFSYHAGGTLSSISRIELMQKLARTDKPADLPDPNTSVPLTRS
jgi:CC1-like splicing factor